MSRREIADKFDEIVAFSEIERFIDTPVKRYSSGMYVRLAFAVAAHLEPEILIVDEVLAVGDASFQKKCVGKMADVGREGRTILFVSHNLGAIKTLCSRAIVLQNGELLFDGDVFGAVSVYAGKQNDDIDRVGWGLPDAPATPSAKMMEVGILNDGKRVGTDVSTELPIQIYIKFRVLKEARIGTTVLLHNSDGALVFISISNHEQNWHGKIRRKGIYRSVCEIPPNFLSEGQIHGFRPFLGRILRDRHCRKRGVAIYRTRKGIREGRSSLPDEGQCDEAPPQVAIRFSRRSGSVRLRPTYSQWDRPRAGPP